MSDPQWKGVPAIAVALDKMRLLSLRVARLKAAQNAARVRTIANAFANKGPRK